MTFIQVGKRWINMDQVFSIEERSQVLYEDGQEMYPYRLVVRSQDADWYEIFEEEEAQLLKLYLSHRSVQLKRYQPLLEEGDGCTTASD